MAISFQFIRKKKDGSNFISMYDFYNSIEKKNLIDEQRKLSPFNEQLDLFYICLLVGLNNNLKANENDLIMFSDPDEIPNPEKLRGIKMNKKYAIFLQNMYTYKINILNQYESPWEGTRICKKKDLKSIDWLRQKILAKKLLDIAPITITR